ncbi:TetR/AcrR family transcriptional regulator [Saccharothrix coeruleofusca]|uniref:TetR family transcriptional regulator n=1 Tax=Saccharothrix coeruleofusca TaxID=33919 RepID=A0A918AVH9_9PSEU|nr:TetR/AcrR family transcriptional regulator [Saccharothrix coeruleofusca]MBP2336803.1 AcrR family transcriptional regulator [Saccharothrix coeruleofusca]GGP82677.1 TetR family transcriptional regulator [Saccharothrix coeruleofusca]
MTADLSASDDTPLRADARRNRDQIIGAAKKMFAERGPDVPMEEIARRAEVGVGTLYRRFPDRDALIRAVVRDNMADALAYARAAAVEEPTGWSALVRLLSHSTELGLSVRLSMLSPTVRKTLHGDPVLRELRSALLTAFETIVGTAQAEGSLRTDVSASDVAIVYALLLRQPQTMADSTAQLATGRALALVLEGLRARPDAPPDALPGRRLTAADLLLD